MAAFRVAEVILGAGAGLGVAQAVLAQVELPELSDSQFGVGVIVSLVTAAITATGTTFFQPWLRTRDLARRNQELMDQLTALLSNYERLLKHVEEQDDSDKDAIARFGELTEYVTRLTARNLRLANAILVNSGRVAVGTADATLRAVAPASPPLDASSRVLVLGSDYKSAEAFAGLIEGRGYLATVTEYEGTALSEMAEHDFAAMLLDLPSLGHVERFLAASDHQGSLPPSVVVIRPAGPQSDIDSLAQRYGLHVVGRPARFDEEILPAIATKNGPARR